MLIWIKTYLTRQQHMPSMQVILPLINNWNDTGAVGEVVTWNNLPSHEAFFSDPGAKATYKNTVAAILGCADLDNDSIWQPFSC